MAGHCMPKAWTTMANPSPLARIRLGLSSVRNHPCGRFYPGAIAIKLNLHNGRGHMRIPIVVGSLRARTLFRLRIENNKVVELEKLIEHPERIRDVAMGPNGYVYVLIEHKNGGSLLRLVPSVKPDFWKADAAQSQMACRAVNGEINSPNSAIAIHLTSIFMSQPVRRRLSPENRRNQLLDCARQVAYEHVHHRTGRRWRLRPASACRWSTNTLIPDCSCYGAPEIKAFTKSFVPTTSGGNYRDALRGYVEVNFRQFSDGDIIGICWAKPMPPALSDKEKSRYAPFLLRK